MFAEDYFQRDNFVMSNSVLCILICKFVNPVVRMLVYRHNPGWVELESVYDNTWPRLGCWLRLKGMHILIKFCRNWSKEEVKLVGLGPMDSILCRVRNSGICSERWLLLCLFVIMVDNKQIVVIDNTYYDCYYHRHHHHHHNHFLPHIYNSVQHSSVEINCRQVVGTHLWRSRSTARNCW